MPPNKQNIQKLRKILKYQEDQDSIMTDPKEGDIIIPVMGPTGSGKSSFINKALGSNEIMKVGHKLKSCTSCLQHAFLPEETFPQRKTEGRVILVDTPGFDDTYIDDVEILRRIAVWLSFSYQDGMKLAGLIYLHDISQFRISGSVRKNLEMFRFLCGEKAMSRVILVTSKWDIAGAAAAKERQVELEEDFWNGVIALGARSHPFQGTTESARSIIDMILTSALSDKCTAPDHVLMQAETVDIHKLIPETKVGRTLRHTLKDTAERQKALDEQLKGSNKDDPALRKECEENRRRLEATLQQIQDLKIPIGRRFLSFLGLTVSGISNCH